MFIVFSEKLPKWQKKRCFNFPELDAIAGGKLQNPSLFDEKKLHNQPNQSIAVSSRIRKLLRHTIKISDHRSHSTVLNENHRGLAITINNCVYRLSTIDYIVRPYKSNDRPLKTTFYHCHLIRLCSVKI